MPDFNNEEDLHQKTRKVRRMPTSTDPETATTLHEQDDNASSGTVTASTPEVIDHISEEGHPVPVILIEDHLAELAQGINPATCNKCGAPMELHAQFEPTMQDYNETEPESLSAHLASEHGVPDLGELDPVEDGLILDRLYIIHEAKHAAISDGNGGTLEAPDPNKPVFQIMPEMQDKIKSDKCPTCSNPVTEFRDELSKKEYSISGMCQNCQDSVFGSPE